MGVARLVVRCNDCEKREEEEEEKKSKEEREFRCMRTSKSEFGIALEWLSKEMAIKEIKGKKCPNCGGDSWYFTDAVDC